MSNRGNIEQSEYDGRWGDDNNNYSAASAGYTPHFLRFMDRWLSTLHAGQPVRVLEIGCGDGYFSEQLAKRGCQVTGIDLSPVGVAKAQSRVPNGKFLVHDLTEPLPFEDGSVDAVWCSEVLEHLFAPLFVLEQVRRVLRPGGVLMATVPYHGLIKNLGIALLAFERHYDPTYPHIRFFTKNTLTDLARKAGLRSQSITTCGSNLGIRDWIAPTNILLAAQK
jgi:SAM-dependent methyltransferase